MCSGITYRTRENPEAAMIHQPDAPAPHQVVMVNPDPCATGKQGFDDAEHRAFMRSLG